jgi:hypothetical protein
MFEVVDYVVQVSPSSLNIPEFKAIWRRDKNRRKKNAHSELSYVYYMCDYKSEYRNYPEDERAQKVFQDHCLKQLGEKWTPDGNIIEAMNKYIELQVTPSMSYLNSVEGIIHKVKSFLNGVDNIDEDTMKTILDSIDKANKIVLSLPKIKESVEKEVSEKDKIRGGGEIGIYED